jgi:hypothetical protein
MLAIYRPNLESTFFQLRLLKFDFVSGMWAFIHAILVFHHLLILFLCLLAKYESN